MSTKPRPQELADLVQEALKGGDPTLVLQALSEATEELHDQFRADPKLAISGELFERSVVILDHCHRIGLYLAEQCRSEEALEAWTLRLGVVLTAYPLRKNFTGPARLDYGICLENLGRTEEAQEAYTAIIKDVTPILGWGPTFNEDWLCAVRSLRSALDRSRDADGELKERTAHLLEQSEEMKRNQQA